MAETLRLTSGDRRSHRPQRGFTLVELVISAGLLSFLAVTATFFWVNGFDLVQRTNNDTMAVAGGRAALERLARELREVKYDTAAGAFCIQSLATATQIMRWAYALNPRLSYYIGGYFWWYAAEDALHPGALLRTALQAAFRSKLARSGKQASWRPIAP